MDFGEICEESGVQLPIEEHKEIAVTSESD